MVDPVDSDPLQNLVRGRLSRDEAARLEAEIQGNPRMEADLRLVEALNQTDSAVHPFPGEFGWARLSNAIDRQKPRAFWQRNVSAWQVAALVAIAIGCWQLAVAPHLAGHTAPQGYITATGSQGTTSAQNTLRIAFAPAGTELAIRRLLRDAGARIVDGPTAVGLYTLAFDTEEQRDTAAKTLASSKPLVGIIDIE
ncbi:hypothetical protein RDV64_17990 [Acuticoccus sp. MNP-M23]|uniref:hypothetical protein n=1 Tax=Acuticoccus sp. MNP-M23 TaxID=3072793 RepID=UPI002814B6CF|nr:hypothetical protein [Acuticoccus sp. MNP-M23]WMS41939.1 hypothetical protein RDV64_17990 [Acuticoccus sp. MNP-M23]